VLTANTLACNAYGSLTTPSLEAGVQWHAANVSTIEAVTRRKLEQCATQPMLIQQHAAGGAVKPRLSMGKSGKQATCMTGRLVAC